MKRGVGKIGMSASMIVRNEEEGIGPAIESLRRVEAIDEIVVLDTGSSDRTIAVARDHGAVVHRQEWRDDFSLHRNQCLDLCRNDWVFSLDGDEVLAEVGDLDACLCAPDDHGIAVFVRCVGPSGTGESFASIRAFDRRYGRWKYPVHNQVLGIERAKLSTASITAHYDENTHESTKERLAVLLRHRDLHPDDPHYPFYIAKAHRTLGDFVAVRHWARIYLEISDGHPHAASAWCWLIEAALSMGDQERASVLIQEGLRRYEGFPDLHHLDLALAARRWYSSVLEPRGEYLTLPSRSRGYASGFPAGVSALGLPIQLPVKE